MEKESAGKSEDNQKRFCPFRVNSKYCYECYEGCEPVVTSQVFEYAPCYKEGCPFYYYDTVSMSFKCKQCDELQEGSEYYER